MSEQACCCEEIRRLNVAHPNERRIMFTDGHTHIDMVADGADLQCSADKLTARFAPMLRRLFQEITGTVQGPVNA